MIFKNLLLAAALIAMPVAGLWSANAAAEKGCACCGEKCTCTKCGCDAGKCACKTGGDCKCDKSCTTGCCEKCKKK